MSEWWEGIKADFVLNFINEDRWTLLVTGLGNTLKITFVALIIGILLGSIVATVRSTYDKNGADMAKRNKGGYVVLSIFNIICKLYLTVIRGTPMVVQLLIMYFIIFASSNNGLMVAMIAFGINSGAYVAEIIRGGIMSIDKGQFEAGRSLGLSYLQTMVYIILPQAFKNVLPALGNEFIVLLKETSVSGYIALQDLTKAGDIIRSQAYTAFMPLIAVAVIYLAVVMLFSFLLGKLERRLKNNE